MTSERQEWNSRWNDHIIAREVIMRKSIPSKSNPSHNLN